MGKSVAKQKKLQRQQDVLNAKHFSGLIDIANQVEDLLAEFVPFQYYSRNGLSADLSSYAASTCEPELLDWALLLCKQHMEQLYTEVWGSWSDAKKRKQLTANDSRFIVASLKGEPQQCLGYLNFRFEMEQGQPTMYIYDLQLERQVQGKGLGKFLMQLGELIARKLGMQMVMLTVMVKNAGARELYRRLGYTVSETSPGANSPPEEPQCGYYILEKHLESRVKQPQAAAAGPEQQQAAAAAL